MSTIFGHGRLRLYLLKLLDENPRHGYEIISLLRDRFLGVYSPSPGTIYPRLARLEEEGLVTHEEVDGRKVYRLTDKGRAELRRRSSDLEDLEREITESVRDVARAVKQDVRDTISSLREELKFAAGGGRRTAQADRGPAEGDEASGTSAGERTGEQAEDSGHDRGGSWWERDWEKFTQGFGAWAKRGGPGGRTEFEQTLHDFTDRVRDVVREAGHVGESAAHDLRRILDDTLEVIRRDAASWGPCGADDKPDGSSAPQPGSKKPEAEPDDEGRHTSQDPWSAAVDGDGDAGKGGDGPDHGPRS
ncbi:MAG: PadR family transcriptional regulator [Nocardiopsaceae bacterium]|nr:PadR family transcriptional regulator [Nocardiopsaceae bacterium]